MRGVLILALAQVACEVEPPPVAPEQRARAESLQAAHGASIKAKEEALRELVAAQAGIEGPLMPRPDLGGCPQLEQADLLLKAEPLPAFAPENAAEAAQALEQLSVAADEPRWTSRYLVSATYEIAVEPTVDPERNGFTPGAGRATAAVVDVATGDIVCLGRSGLKTTTSDVQILRRPVRGELSAEERAAKQAENLAGAQRQVEEAFKGQLLKAAQANMAQAGPFDAETSGYQALDLDAVRAALGR